jgi:NAD(P)-dependent dehydrogenase (short-subunit alcohol dehydrogenase family)
MTGRLDGRVALVTGAGQGIGRGTALALAKEGAALALVGRTVSKCEAVAAEIEAFGGTAISVECDVSVRAQVDAAVAATVSHFGGIDILVNNAQTSVQATLEETTYEDIELAWHTGALGTFYAMQSAFPHLRARGGGTIVNFGSSTAIEGNAAFGAYAMAKEAIRGLSRVASREWGPFGIRVNVIVPNALSPSSEDFRDAHPERFARMEARVPLGRVGDPENDIGKAVVALAADELTYLTGQTLMLTGGA